MVTQRTRYCALIVLSSALGVLALLSAWGAASLNRALESLTSAQTIIRVYVAAISLLAAGGVFWLGRTMLRRAEMNDSWVPYVVPVERRPLNRWKNNAVRAILAVGLGTCTMRFAYWAMIPVTAGRGSLLLAAAAFVLGSVVAVALWVAFDLPFADAFAFGKSFPYALGVYAYRERPLTMADYLKDLDLHNVSNLDLSTATPRSGTKSTWRLLALKHKLPGLSDDESISAIVRRACDPNSDFGQWWAARQAAHRQDKAETTNQLASVRRELADLNLQLDAFDQRKRALWDKALAESRRRAVPKTCPACAGKGAGWIVTTCFWCGGAGGTFVRGGLEGWQDVALGDQVVTYTYWRRSQTIPCTGCHGSGKQRVWDKCPNCEGSGTAYIGPPVERILAADPDHVQLMRECAGPSNRRKGLLDEEKRLSTALAGMDQHFLAAAIDQWIKEQNEPPPRPIADGKDTARPLPVRQLAVPGSLATAVLVLSIIFPLAETRRTYVRWVAEAADNSAAHEKSAKAISSLTRCLAIHPGNADLLTSLAWSQAWKDIDAGEVSDATVAAVARDLARIDPASLASYPDLHATITKPRLAGVWRSERGLELLLLVAGDGFAGEVLSFPRSPGKSSAADRPSYHVTVKTAGCFAAFHFVPTPPANEKEFWVGGFFEHNRDRFRIHEKGNREYWRRVD